MVRRIAERRALLGRIALCLLVLTLAGACDAARSKPKPLLLGLSDWPGHAPFYGADKLGYFGGTPVEIRSFSSNFDRNRAFAQGRLDVLATPLFDAIRIADDGVALKVILLFDYSSGGDGIAARQEIAAVRDLKGKRVSAEVGAITHFVLLAALSQAGLKEEDVQIVNLSVPEGADAFGRGKLDAATLWDPHLSRQASAPGAHKLFTSKEIPGQVIDVLIVQREVADKRPEDVANIVRGWEQALSAYRARPAEVGETFAKASNRTADGLKADFLGMELLDLGKNHELFQVGQAGAAGQSVWKSYEATARFMVDHHLLKHPAPAAADILEPRFIEQARAK